MKTNLPPPSFFITRYRAETEKGAVQMYSQHSRPGVCRESSNGTLPKIPASLTTASSCPNASTAASTIAWPPAGLSTRIGTEAIALPPAFVISSTTSSATGVGAVTTHRAAQVVDHHRCTRRARSSAHTAESTPASGDHRHAVGKVNHVVPLIDDQLRDAARGRSYEGSARRGAASARPGRGDAAIGEQRLRFVQTSDEETRSPWPTVRRAAPGDHARRPNISCDSPVRGRSR